MPRFLGVDVGTTKIAALILDTDTAAVLAMSEAPNESETTSAADKARGRSEWDAERVAQLTFGCIRDVIAKCHGDGIQGVGVAGQMHGMTLVDERQRAIAPFIGWRDQRCQENVPDKEMTYIAWMLQAAGLGGFARTGCPPATGYMGSTLFWLAKNGQPGIAKGSAPTAAATACFLSDYVVMRLTGEAPAADPTNAGGSGVFDVISGQWNRTLIERLGLRPEVFPPIRRSGTVLGGVRAELAAETGLAPGTPVCVGCGDNQAGFAGCVADAPNAVLINLGTGAQVSVWVPKSIVVPAVDMRPHLDGGYLLVGAPLCGGISYAFLRDFILSAGEDFFNTSGPDEAVYERMNQLAATVPPGADGLCCEPLFNGTRLEPDRRATFTGISPANFTPAHFARAILEGVAARLHHHYNDMIENGVQPRKTLIGAGNGVRRNPLFADILKSAFAMPLYLPASTEESAFGAALLAGVGTGHFSSLHEACNLVKYQES